MAALYDVVFSSEQQEGSESFVSQWLKREGAFVAENDPLVEVSTDKVNVEIASPVTGIVRQILKQPNDQIRPGDVLVKIEPSKAALESSTSSPGNEDPRPAQESHKPLSSDARESASKLSPLVRRLLDEHGLRPEQIAGSGRGGRITHEDVVSFLARTSESATCSGIPGETIALNPVRKSIAHHMVNSLLHVAPHVTSVFEVDFTAVLAQQQEMKTAFAADGVRLTLTPFLLAAMVKAVRAVPESNASFANDSVTIFSSINIGIATAVASDKPLQAGLVVPVLKDAGQRSIKELAQELDRLSAAARANRLSPQDVRGGTITISNHGMGGSLFAAPIIINQPQVAIVGVGKIERRPVLASATGAEEKLEFRPRAYVTLTIDHRVLDGFRANQFLAEMKRALEEDRFA